VRAAPLLTGALILAGPTANAHGGFDLDLLRPPGGVRDFVATASPTVAHDLETGGGVLLSFANRPLVAVGGDGEADEVLVDHRVVADVYASIGLLDLIEVSLAMPIGVTQQGRGPGDEELASTGPGDVRFGVKMALLNPRAGGLTMALAPRVTFPSGNPDDLRGAGVVSASPAMVVGHQGRRHRIAFEAGAVLHEPTRVANLEFGRQVYYRGALAWQLGPRTEGLMEFAGRTSELPAQGAAAEHSPAQALAALRVSATDHIQVTLGAGAGISGGYGAPDYRAFAGVAWAQADRDGDGDGRPDRRDDCPDTPEDPDGFEDADGCPDLDNDNDGVPDSADRCPTPRGPGVAELQRVVEDVDGHEDADGCPDTDNDQDGVEDAQDRCPGAAEDIDGFEDIDGCPDLDNDGDGLPDLRDECPRRPEDLDGHQDDDGCPDLDNDGDGLADERDGCPVEAEDRDGFEDDDGCPDPDNDADGVDDTLDLCPADPEDVDGMTDDDGCPDEKGRSRIVAIRDGRVIPLEAVQFERQSAELRPVSRRILDELARVLNDHPELGTVRIEAHLDAQGDPRDRRALSQTQALAVMRHLVMRGVDPVRLIAQGLGADRPIDTRGTPEGRAANRRVEFQVMGP